MSLSIITAIHNSLAMNRLYWKSLHENTTSPFELLIIDNHSTDGSEKFFKELEISTADSDHQVRVLRNEFNQPYPHSQIQGMEAAKFDVLCFLNNDIWLPRGWNEPIEKVLGTEPYLVVSPSGQEAQPTQRGSDLLKNRWKKIRSLSSIWQKVFFKTEEERLWKALEWMYGDLTQFENPTPKTELGYFSGLKGDSVIFRKTLLQVLPEPWDKRIEAADWHLYLSLAKLHEERSEVPLPRVLTTTYSHHFGRYSARQKYEPYRQPVYLQDLKTIWPQKDIDKLWWGRLLPH